MSESSNSIIKYVNYYGRAASINILGYVSNTWCKFDKIVEFKYMNGKFHFDAPKKSTMNSLVEINRVFDTPEEAYSNLLMDTINQAEKSIQSAQTTIEIKTRILDKSKKDLEELQSNFIESFI